MFNQDIEVYNESGNNFREKLLKKTILDCPLHDMTRLISVIPNYEKSLLRKSQLFLIQPGSIYTVRLFGYKNWYKESFDACNRLRSNAE